MCECVSGFFLCAYLFARYLLDYIFVFLVLAPLCSKHFPFSSDLDIPHENIRVGLAGFCSCWCCRVSLSHYVLSFVLDVVKRNVLVRCPKCFRYRNFVHACRCRCVYAHFSAFDAATHYHRHPRRLFSATKFSYDLFIELCLQCVLPDGGFNCISKA